MYFFIFCNFFEKLNLLGLCKFVSEESVWALPLFKKLLLCSRIKCFCVVQRVRDGALDCFLDHIDPRLLYCWLLYPYIVCLNTILRLSQLVWESLEYSDLFMSWSIEVWVPSKLMNLYLLSYFGWRFSAFCSEFFDFLIVWYLLSQVLVWCFGVAGAFYSCQKFIKNNTYSWSHSTRLTNCVLWFKFS